MTRTGSDVGVKVAAGNVAKMEDVTDVVPTAFGALQSEPESGFQMLKEATRKYCFIKHTSLNELEDLNELEMSFALL